MRLRRRVVSPMLAHLILFAVIILTIPRPAAAATYQALQEPVVGNGEVCRLSGILAQFYPGQLKQGDVAVFRLPAGFIWTTAALGEGQSAGRAAAQTTEQWNTADLAADNARYGPSNCNYVNVPRQHAGNDNGLFKGGTPVFQLARLSDSELRMELVAEPEAGQNCCFYLYLNRIYVDSGYRGVVSLYIDAPAGSGFAGGAVTSGRVSSAGVDPGTTIKCDRATTVYTGMLGQKIGAITITEAVPGDLQGGRTLTLQLPEGARWGNIDESKLAGRDVMASAFTGADARTLQLDFKTTSRSATTYKLEGLEVVLEPGLAGELKVRIGGTAGLTGELVVSRIAEPVSLRAAAVPEGKIGTVSRAGDITVAEKTAGLLKEGGWLVFELPAGVSFAAVPKVEVVGGNLRIEAARTKLLQDGGEDASRLAVYIGKGSTTAATLKVSDTRYFYSSNAPLGDLAVELKGDAVIEVNDKAAVERYYKFVGRTNTVEITGRTAFTLNSDRRIFPASDAAASTVNARVSALRPGELAALFTIGRKGYFVNGSARAMDVSPFIDRDRTYLPVRFVAQALGVAGEDIIWNQADRSVTLRKGNRLARMVIGSMVMRVNEIPVSMDAEPRIIEPGRTMLPIRWIGEALGASLEWDADTRTVMVTTQ